MTREQHPPSSPASPGGQDHDNPFAPPPEGSPDRPWQPRQAPRFPQSPPGDGGEGAGAGDTGAGQRGTGAGSGSGSGGAGSGHGGGSGNGHGGGSGNGSGDGSGNGSGGGSGNGSGGDAEGRPGGQPGEVPPQPQQPPQQQPPVWGSQWSSRQPRRQNGGFGSGPGGNRAPGQNGGQRGGSGGLRWDPTDPVQRRARYALLAGMWAFFFALFSLKEIALLLGALSLYWAISSLRAKPRPAPAAAGPAVDAPPPAPDATRAPLPAPRANGAKPQSVAAISGLVAGGIALAIVAATYAFQFVYSDYYTCVDDALTHESRQACEQILPEQLRPLLSTDD
ncbi:hypothetical protein CD790_23535 [Streptomyces sp. SAJ15]|nr:hypothetical protein CD790_23535 [Streptomyces sp. SAJ15]